MIDLLLPALLIALAVLVLVNHKARRQMVGRNVGRVVKSKEDDWAKRTGALGE